MAGWRTLVYGKSFSTSGQQSCSSEIIREKDAKVRRGYEWIRFLMKAASRRAESRAYAVVAFVSREPFRPQNHPVTLQGTREKNPNNRWSKNITDRLFRPFNCAPKYKAYWFSGRIFPLFLPSTARPRPRFAFSLSIAIFVEIYSK